jgi:dihydropteroate synthase
MNQTGTPAWKVGPSRSLSLDQPRLMGVLNVTPDSFSDGGQFLTVAEAVDFAMGMMLDGASIIDVGGESTRPGAKPVPAVEQIHRIVPAIRGIRYRLNSQNRGPRHDLLISIDTTRATVAKAALDAGADIINDVSAGLDDPEMLPLAASRQCGLIIMHRLRPPAEDVYSHQHVSAPHYNGDVLAVVRDFLAERAKAAIAAGVNPAAIVVDPGLGFGKSVEQNYCLLGRISEFRELGYPVLSASSRKSFLGAVSGIDDPAARMIASTAVSVNHYAQGVRLFRVHDVAAHREALAIAAAIQSGTVTGSPPR